MFTGREIGPRKRTLKAQGMQRFQSVLSDGLELRDLFRIAVGAVEAMVSVGETRTAGSVIAKMTKVRQMMDLLKEEGTKQHERVTFRKLMALNML